MQLITKQATLEQFLPNPLKTVSGEPSFYDRLVPFLAKSEVWLGELICPISIIAELKASSDIRRLATQAVAYDALLHGIPALDLVLTPNGFGIVSNANVVPASKERISRLLASTERNRDDALESLLAKLPELQAWQQSAQRAYWTSTLFPSISVARQIGETDHRLSRYLEIREQITDIEGSLEEEYFSVPLMGNLRLQCVGRVFSNLPPASIDARLHLITHIRAQIIEVLKGMPIIHRAMISLVNIIRTHESYFPEWFASPLAEIYNPPTFQNKKDAAGYFW